MGAGHRCTAAAGVEMETCSCGFIRRRVTRILRTKILGLELIALTMMALPSRVIVASQDSVDVIQRGWRRSYPELDTSPAGVTARILRINVFLNRNSEEVFQGFHTTGPSFDVLAALFAAGPPYRLTPTDLYRGHMMSSAGITARLDVVERAGLAARSRDPKDRRGVLVTLTKTGQKLVRDGTRALHRRQSFLPGIYAEPERTQALALLKRLLIPLERSGTRTTLPGFEAAVAPWAKQFPDSWLLEFLVAIPLLTIRINRDSDQLLWDFHLAGTAWWTLCALRRSDQGRLSPGDLSRAVALSSAGMTAQLDQLEKSALVKRSPDPEDRRAIDVTLTRSGQRLVDRAIGPYLAVHERILRPLPARDRQTLSGLLRKMLLSLEGDT